MQANCFPDLNSSQLSDSGLYKSWLIVPNYIKELPELQTNCYIELLDLFLDNDDLSTYQSSHYKDNDANSALADLSLYSLICNRKQRKELHS